MKILSKYKDFYDYLIGRYGVDEKIVLDRTKFDNVYPQNGLIRIYFCNYLVEGIYKEDRGVVYGEELLNYYAKELKPERNFNYDDRFYYLTRPKEEYQKWQSNYFKMPKEPILIKESPNKEFDCPILVENSGVYGEYSFKTHDRLFKYYSKFPPLERYNFNRVFSAEDVYLKLYDWLTQERPMIEIGDKEKIVGHGFDLKSSFRNIK
jgi:hypothetical protein